MSYRGRGSAPLSAPRAPEDSWNDPQIGRIRRAADIGPPAVRSVPLRFQNRDAAPPRRGRGRGSGARGGGPSRADDAERDAYYENRGESSRSAAAPVNNVRAAARGLPPRPVEAPRREERAYREERTYRGRASRSPSPDRRRQYSPSAPAVADWSARDTRRTRDQSPPPRRNRPPVAGANGSAAGPSRPRGTSPRPSESSARAPPKAPPAPTPLSQLPPPPPTTHPLKLTLNNYNRRPDEPKPAAAGASKAKAAQQSEARRALQREPSSDIESSDEEPLRRRVPRPPPHPSLHPIDGILAGNLPPKASLSRKAEAEPKAKKATGKAKAPKATKSPKKAKPLFEEGPDVKPDVLDLEEDLLIDEKDDFREPTPEPPKLQLEGVHAVKRSDLPANVYGGDVETRRRNRNAFRSRLRAQLRSEGKRDVGIHWRDDGCAVDWKRIEPGQLSSDIEIIEPPSASTSRTPAAPSTPNGGGSSSDSDIEFIDPPAAPPPATPVEVVDVASAPPTAPRAPRWATSDTVQPAASSSDQPPRDASPPPALKVAPKNHRPAPAVSETLAPATAQPKAPSPAPPAAKIAPTPPPPAPKPDAAPVAAQPARPSTQPPASRPAWRHETPVPPAQPVRRGPPEPFVAPTESNAELDDIFLVKLHLPAKYRTEEGREAQNFSRWLQERCAPYQAIGDDGQPIEFRFSYVDDTIVHIYRPRGVTAVEEKSKLRAPNVPAVVSGSSSAAATASSASSSAAKPSPGPSRAPTAASASSSVAKASPGPAKAPAASNTAPKSSTAAPRAHVTSSASSSVTKSSTGAAKPRNPSAEDDEEMMFMNRSMNSGPCRPSSGATGPVLNGVATKTATAGTAGPSRMAEASATASRTAKRSRADGSPGAAAKEPKKAKPAKLVPEALAGMSQAKAVKREAASEPPAEPVRPRQNISLARGTSRAAASSSSFSKPSARPVVQPVAATQAGPASAPASVPARPTLASSTAASRPATRTPAAGASAAPATRSLKAIEDDMKDKMDAITRWTQLLDTFPGNSNPLKLQVQRTEKEIFTLQEEWERAKRAAGA